MQLSHYLELSKNIDLQSAKVDKDVDCKGDPSVYKVFDQDIQIN